jgi:hypothetical protein
MLPDPPSQRIQQQLQGLAAALATRVERWLAKGQRLLDYLLGRLPEQLAKRPWPAVQAAPESKLREQE